MRALASEYYSLVWRAVREGPCAAEDILSGLGITCGQLADSCALSAGVGSFAGLDVADKFSCMANAVVSSLMAQLFSILIDIKAEECLTLAELSATIKDLASALLKDLGEEAALYRKPPEWFKTKSVSLRLAKEAASMLEGECGGAERFKPTPA